MTDVYFDDERFYKIVSRNTRRAVIRSAFIVQKNTKRLLNRGASNRGRTPAPPGKSPHKDTGTLGRSIQVDDRGITDKERPSARVGSNAVYAAIHEFGGEIRPKSSRYLTVPIGQTGRDLLRRGGLRAIPDTFVFRSRKGNLIVARTRGKARKAAMEAIAVLKDSVRIPRRPFLRPGLRMSNQAILDEFTFEKLTEGYRFRERGR